MSQIVITEQTRIINIDSGEKITIAQDLVKVVSVGTQGPVGPAGPDGADGAAGPAGADGTNGVGVPAGGTTGHILAKVSGSNYDSQWTNNVGARFNALSFHPTLIGPSGTGMYLHNATALGFCLSGTRYFDISTPGVFTMGNSVENSSVTINTKVNGGMRLFSTHASGPAFNIQQSGQTDFQFFNNTGNFGLWNNTLGVTIFAISGGTGASVRTVSGGVIGFSSNTTNAASFGCDTAMSRVSAGVFAFGQGTAGNTTAEIRHGHSKCMQAGNGFFVKEGTNARMGQATLVGGTVTVNTNQVNANSRIFLSVETAGGTQGFLSYTEIIGTSFTINSTSATETSIVNWLIMEAA